MTPRREIRVRVIPASRRESVTRIKNMLEICVTEPPENNRANARVCTLVARHYRVPEKSVRILRGHRSARKILSVPAACS